MAGILFLMFRHPLLSLQSTTLRPARRDVRASLSGPAHRNLLQGCALNNQAVGASGAGEGAGPEMLGSVTISVLRTSTRRRG